MSSVDWVRVRLERDVHPAIGGEPAKDLAKSLKQNRGYDIIVLDGAPGTPKRTAELVPACDLIVLPTGASRADLVPTLALARRIAENEHTGVGPIFALCRVMTESEAATAREAIAAAGFEVFDGELIERPGYRQAQIGRSPTETAFPSLNDKARKLARNILDRLAWDGIRLG